MSEPRFKLGSYRLIRRIGVGGMAEVYEAELGGTQGFGKRLAIKVLLPHFQRDAEVVRSFIDEANIAASLSHPNIVPIYDFGQIDGTYYLAMEYQNGWDLREVLQSCRRLDRALPVPAAAYVGHELALGLRHVHTREREIVHRDVSPHNLFVGRDGHVKLGDFGVAKAEARLARTLTGQIKGKLAYLAPEQARGDVVSARTDVYAAGLVLFEMLTGERYNDAERDVDLLSAATRPRARSPSSLRPEAAALDEVVGGALQEHPAMRTRDAALLSEQLAGYLQRRQFDARGLAAFVSQLEQADGARQPGAGIPVASLGVGRPSRGTDPPTSGTLKLGRGPAVTSSPSIGPALIDLSEAPGGWHHRRRLLIAIAILAVTAASMLALVLEVLSVSRSRPRGDSAAADAGRVDVSLIDVQLAAAAPPEDGAVRGAADASIRDVDASSHDVRLDAVLVAGGHSVRRVRRSPRRRGGPRRSPASRSPVAAQPVPQPARPEPVAHTALGSETVAAWRARLAALAARARSRGLWPGDDALHDQRCSEARRAIAARDPGAGAALDRLSTLVDGFRSDQRFIRRKMDRLERAIGQAPAADRQRLSLAAQRVLRLVLAERLVEASQQISAALASLR